MQDMAIVRVHRTKGGYVNGKSVGNRGNREGHEQIEALPGRQEREIKAFFESTLAVAASYTNPAIPAIERLV